MPALGEDWILEAEAYAEDVYGVTIDELGFDFNDASVYMESATHWVDTAWDEMKEPRRTASMMLMRS